MKARYSTMLILAALFWGTGNVPQKTVLEHIGPMTAVGLRCMIGVVAIGPALYLDRRAFSIPGFVSSALPGAFLFVSALGLQQIAYLTTSVTNASFLVNTATVMTPLAAWVLLKERPSGQILLAAMLTLLGAWLMAGATGLSHMQPGDLACLGSAFFYAGWMIAIDSHSRRYAFPFATAMIQFQLAFLVFLPLGITVEGNNLDQMAMALPGLMFLGVFSTAAAFGLQVYAQRHTSASAAAVLVSGESIFGALAAYLILGEVTPSLGLAGAGMIFASILIVALSGSGTPAAPAKQ